MIKRELPAGYEEETKRFVLLDVSIVYYWLPPILSIWDGQHSCVSITLLSGKVRYVIYYLDCISTELGPSSQAVISSQMEYHLEMIGNVELYLEFCAK